MPHPLYNPFSSGNQRSTQGQYGLPSVQAERHTRMASPCLGPGSSLSSSGASSGTPANSGGMLPSLVPQSMNYRPEQGRPAIDEDVERPIDMHISRAREEVRLLGTPMQQPTGQGSYLTSTQRDELLSSGTGMTTYPMSSTSASLGHLARHSKVESASGSLDWLSDYKRPTADDPSKFYSSPPSSSYAGGGDCRFNSSSERERDMSSIPGLGDYEYLVPDKPAAPTESSRPKYTSESAANILLHFGLEEEDLEYLIAYPEDQITPANLPFILRQIRIQKAKRDTTVVQSKPYPEPPPTRSVSGMDSFSSSGGAGMCQETASSILQPSKVIDYGHIGKYAGGVGDEIGRPSGSRPNSGGMKDNCDSGSHSQDPLQKNPAAGRSSTLGSSHDQASSGASLSSSYSSILSSVAPSSNDPTKRLQTHQNQTPQEILSSFSLPKKDTDIRILKSDASKPVPLKEPERPGLVVIGSNDSSGTKDQSKTQGQGSTVAEQMKKQQKQPMHQQQQGQKQKAQQQTQHKQQAQKQQAQQQQQAQTQQQQQAQKQQAQQQQQAQKQQAQQQQQAQKQQAQKQQAQQQQQAQKQQAQQQQQAQTQQQQQAQKQQAQQQQQAQKQQAQQQQQAQKQQAQQQQQAQKQQAQQQQQAQKQQTQHQQQAQKQQVQRQQQTQKQQLAQKSAISHSQMGQTMCPPVFSAAKPIPPIPIASPIPSITGVRRCPMFIPGDHHRTIMIPPGPPQPIPINFVHTMLLPSNTQLPAKVAVFKGLPTPAMMHDYAAATPRIFPHTCVLCNKECTHMKDWISHQNASLHLESCKLLRRQYPEWDGEVALGPSVAGKDVKPSPSTSAQTNEHHHQKTRHGSRSRSNSLSPRRHYGSEGRSERRRSRTRLPHSSRYTRRSWSRSRSHSRSSSPTSSSHSHRSRSRSYERRSPPWRSDDRQLSPRRSHEKRLSPTRTHERRPSLITPDRSSTQRNRSSSAERLAKKLLETSAVQSLSNRSDLEAVVKTLAPALLAELAKMKSSTSSSKEGKRSLSPPSTSGKKSSSSSSSPSIAKKKDSTKEKPSLQKSETSSSAKTKAGKSSPPTMVKLQGIPTSLSHDDVVANVECFGKTKATILIRSKLQAIVCFEKEEDAKKLKSMKNLTMKGFPVTVFKEKVTDFKEQNKSPQRKPATSSVSMPQTTQSTTSPTRKAPLPTPNMPPLPMPKMSFYQPTGGGIKKTTAGKLPTNKKITAKSQATVTKAEVLVSRVKNVSTKQISKTVKTGKVATKGVVKKVLVKQKVMDPENPPDGGDSKQKLIPEKSETSLKETVVVLKETAEVDQSANTSVAKLRVDLFLKTKAAPCIYWLPLTEEQVAQRNLDRTEQQKERKRRHKKQEEDEEKKREKNKKERLKVQRRKSSVSTPQTTKSTTSPTRKAPLPTPNTPPLPMPKMPFYLPTGGGIKKTTTGKLPTNQKIAAKGQVTVTKAKVLVSRAKNYSTKQIARTVKMGKVAAKGVVKKVLVKQKVMDPENPPDGGDSKQRLAPEKSETSLKETVVVLKETAEVDQSANTSVAESNKGTEIMIEEKVSASKTASAMQKPKTPPAKLTAASAVTKEKVEETASMTESVTSKSTASDNHLDVQTSKMEESESKVQESVMALKHAAEVVETANVTVSEPKNQAELAEADVEAKEVKDSEPMEHGVQDTEPMEHGVKITEPMEHGVQDTEPMEHGVKDSEPMDQGVKCTEPMEHRVKDTEPMEHGVKDTEPMEHGVKDTKPMDQGVKGTEPMKHRVKDSEPMKHGVQDSEPMEHRVKDTEPMEHGVKDTEPMEHGVKDSEPMKHRVKDTKPMKHGVKDSEPMKHRVKDSESMKHGVQDSEPMEHRVKDTEPMEHGVKDTEPMEHGVKDTEPMEHGETGVEVAEPMEVDSCTEGNGEKPTTTEAVSEISSAKSNDSQPLTSTAETQPDVSLLKPPTIPTQSTDSTPKSSGDTNTQTPQTAIKSPETSVTASPQVQQNTFPEPESTGQEPETKTEASHMEEQAAGSLVQAAVETKLTDGRVETKTKQNVVSKRKSELVGPEAKRPRSQSPCVAADFKLPPFKPNNPLGQEFVVPKSGYLCNICSIFYLNETTAKDLHCSSQKHYDNLQKHYQTLQKKPSRTSTQSSQGSISD